MKKFIIYHDVGHGMEYQEIEEESLNEALAEAYESWREAVESDAIYGVVEDRETTDEMRDDYL